MIDDTPLARMAGQLTLSGHFLADVCSMFGVTFGDLRSKRRGHVTLARWALAYMHRQHLGWSYERIADLLGKEHSAMLYGYTQSCILLHERIQPFADAVELLEKKHGFH